MKAPVIDPVAVPAAAANATSAQPEPVVAPPAQFSSDLSAPAAPEPDGVQALQPTPEDLPVIEALAAANALSIAPEPATQASEISSLPVPAPTAAAPPQPAPAEGAVVEVAVAATTVPASPPTVRALRRFRSAAKAVAQPAPMADPLPANFSATPASRPGVAWTGEIRGRAAELPVELAKIPEAVEAAVPEPQSPASADQPQAAKELTPPVERVPAAELSVATAAEPVGAKPVPPPPPIYDEDEAMRAIEGGWSRVKARAMSEAPELSDLGAAVAAATTAVEQVLAKAGIDVDTAILEERPKGLGRPRNGTKDDLKRINGLGALDESTLNNMGVYHYEQIARWSAAQVAWMENHVFARGRIGREDWQAQARALIPPPSF